MQVQRARAEEASGRRQVAAEEGEVARVDGGAQGGGASVERNQDVAPTRDLGVPVILRPEADALALSARVGEPHGRTIEHAGHEVDGQLAAKSKARARR